LQITTYRDVVGKVCVSPHVPAIHLLYKHVPNIHGVGKSGKWLPQGCGKETIGQTTVALHAGKNYPTNGQGPSQPGKGVV